MIESYEVGDKLLPEDFVSDYYMPMGAYQYCEVTDIDADKVQLTYVNEIGHTEDTMLVSKDQMARMLGWEDDPLLGAGDDEVALYEVQMELLIDDSVTQEVADDEIVDIVQNAPTKEEDGNFELLDTEDDQPQVFVEKEDERVVRAWVFASKDACYKAYLKAK